DWVPLPRAADAARELAECLAKHGYRLANPQLLGGSDKQDVEAAINDWLAGVPEDAGLILFWTGHGSSDGGGITLFAAPRRECRSHPSQPLRPGHSACRSRIAMARTDGVLQNVLAILDKIGARGTRGFVPHIRPRKVSRRWKAGRSGRI